MNSSEMDTFIAGLSADWSEFWSPLGMRKRVTHLEPQYDSLYDLHMKLEGDIAYYRKVFGKPAKGPKPYSGEIKKIRSVVYNLWTPADQKLYASLKIQ